MCRIFSPEKRLISPPGKSPGAERNIPPKWRTPLYPAKTVIKPRNWARINQRGPQGKKFPKAAKRETLLKKSPIPKALQGKG